MEPKKTQQTALPAQKDKEVVKADKQQFNVAEFVGEIKAELKRISWTTPEELRSYTKIVVGTTFFFGMGIYFMDLIIQAGLYILESVLHWIV